MNHFNKSQVDYNHKDVQHPNHDKPEIDRGSRDAQEVYIAKGIRYELRRIATALEQLKEIMCDDTTNEHTK